MNPGQAAARFAWQCALASGLVDLASRVRGSTTAGDRVVVVQVSEFHEIARCDVIEQAVTDTSTHEQHGVDNPDARHGELAYAQAAAWLMSQIGESADDTVWESKV